jgi:hypothetical protein
MIYTDCTRNSQKQTNQIPIYVGKRKVGVVEGETFHKSIAPNHYLTTPPAIAFDEDTLEDAFKAGAVWVEVTDRQTGTKYRAKITHIWERGFGLNRGYGDQIALELSGWIRTGAPIQEKTF